MTAIVIPLGRATAAIPKNAEQAQAGMAADLYSVGAGSVAAGEAPAPDPAQTPPPQSSCAETPGSDPDLWLYRDRTTGLLRRYLRFSVEVGRLPSLLGREFFRTRVTSYHATTFEDAVIFVHDVERCLEKLDDLEKKLIAKIVFQDYTQDETARLLGCWRRTVGRRFPETLDRLSDIFLQGGLLERLPVVSPSRQKVVKRAKATKFS